MTAQHFAFSFVLAGGGGARLLGAVAAPLLSKARRFFASPASFRTGVDAAGAAAEVEVVATGVAVDVAGRVVLPSAFGAGFCFTGFASAGAFGVPSAADLPPPFVGAAVLWVTDTVAVAPLSSRTLALLPLRDGVTVVAVVGGAGSARAGEEP
jgi:hypothetical protein